MKEIYKMNNKEKYEWGQVIALIGFIGTILSVFIWGYMGFTNDWFIWFAIISLIIIFFGAGIMDSIDIKIRK